MLQRYLWITILALSLVLVPTHNAEAAIVVPERVSGEDPNIIYFKGNISQSDADDFCESVEGPGNLSGGLWHMELYYTPFYPLSLTYPLDYSGGTLNFSQYCTMDNECISDSFIQGGNIVNQYQFFISCNLGEELHTTINNDQFTTGNNLSFSNDVKDNINGIFQGSILLTLFVGIPLWALLAIKVIK